MICIKKIKFSEKPSSLEQLKGQAQGWEQLFIAKQDVIEAQMINAWPQLKKKKNPAPRGDEGGRVRRAASDSRIYFSIDSLSGHDKLYKLLVWSGAPGRRSIEQSHGQWGGKDKALLLLNTLARSWYCEGTKERSGGLRTRVSIAEAVNGTLSVAVDTPILFCYQSMWGLRRLSHR